jgi:hypothetical protein
MDMTRLPVDEALAEAETDVLAGTRQKPPYLLVGILTVATVAALAAALIAASRAAASRNAA